MQLEITPELRSKWRKINKERSKQDKPPLNFPLFVKTRNRIDEIPESYYQGNWVEHSDKAPCGSVACIAGEAIICNSRSVKAGLAALWSYTSKGVCNYAASLLGLTAEEEDLFDGSAEGWHSKFEVQYYRAKTDKARARVAVRYLDHIINTGEIVDKNKTVHEEWN